MIFQFLGFDDLYLRRVCQRGRLKRSTRAATLVICFDVGFFKKLCISLEGVHKLIHCKSCFWIVIMGLSHRSLSFSSLILPCYF